MVAPNDNELQIVVNYSSKGFEETKREVSGLGDAISKDMMSWVDLSDKAQKAFGRAFNTEQWEKFRTEFDKLGSNMNIDAFVKSLKGVKEGSIDAGKGLERLIGIVSPTTMYRINRFRNAFDDLGGSFKNGTLSIGGFTTSISTSTVAVAGYAAVIVGAAAEMFLAVKAANEWSAATVKNADSMSYFVGTAVKYQDQLSGLERIISNLQDKLGVPLNVKDFFGFITADIINRLTTFAGIDLSKVFFGDNLKKLTPALMAELKDIQDRGANFGDFFEPATEGAKVYLEQLRRVSAEQAQMASDAAWAQSNWEVSFSTASDAAEQTELKFSLLKGMLGELGAEGASVWDGLMGASGKMDKPAIEAFVRIQNAYNNAKNMLRDGMAVDVVVRVLMRDIREGPTPYTGPALSSPESGTGSSGDWVYQGTDVSGFNKGDLYWNPNTGAYSIGVPSKAGGGSFSGWAMVGDSPGGGITPYTEWVYAPQGAVVVNQSQAAGKSSIPMAGGGMMPPMGRDSIDYDRMAIIVRDAVLLGRQ